MPDRLFGLGATVPFEVPNQSALHEQRGKRRSVLVHRVRRPDSHEVLVLRRTVRHGRYWHTVAGAVEPEEAGADAALRELSEETGLDGHLCLIDLARDYCYSDLGGEQGRGCGVLTRRAWLYGSAALAVVCLLAAPVLADVTVTGDRSAYDEVVGAFKKLFSLPGFRAKMTSPQAQGGVFEYAAPNSLHFGVPGGPYEMIAVGGQVATRTNIPGQPSGWRCRTATGGDRPRPLFDPSRATGTYHVSRGPDTVIDGTPVHTIFSAKDGGKKDSIYVGSQNGLPKRVTSGDDTIDYYDYGAPVAITLPPCAQ